LRYFKSLAPTIFIFIIALLTIPSILNAGSDNEIISLMEEDTLSPSSPTHLTFVDSTLSWNATTTNIDGTPLEDLEGYKVYYGTESEKYKISYDVKNVTKYKIDDMIDWHTYYFAVTAYDVSGNESPYSEEIYFKKIPSQHILTVNKRGTSKGVVTSSPEGVNCGSDCDEVYYSGTLVTLIAIPDTDSFFSGWSGSGCSGRGQCILTINADTIVTATFNAEVKNEVKKEFKSEIKKESPQSQKPSGVIFTIQVGAFRNSSYAKALAKRLYEKGYKAYITSFENKSGILFKVCVGKFSNRQEAENLSGKIRSTESLQTFVTLF
jgi:hypothetical protein